MATGMGRSRIVGERVGRARPALRDRRASRARASTNPTAMVHGRDVLLRADDQLVDRSNLSVALPKMKTALHLGPGAEPEPELAVIVGARGPLGVTIGNDVSSRDIEGENPLCLPQAKIYGSACALGPAVLVPESCDEHYQIECRILDGDGAELFAEETSTESMCHSIEELIKYLRRDNPVPAGSVLLTGTGFVPPDDVTYRTSVE